MFITKLSSGKSDSENREIFLVATGVSTLPLRTNIDDEGPLAGADEHLRQVVTNFIKQFLHTGRTMNRLSQSDNLIIETIVIFQTLFTGHCAVRC